MTSGQKVQYISWGVCLLAVLVAVIAWGDAYDWSFSGLSVYMLFPLLGLGAFSIMWSHYIAGVVRRLAGAEKSALKRYFEFTSSAVLVLILLHPGLFLWQIWRDGLGLPPGSAITYVGAGAYWAVAFGSIALTLFLLFELRRLFGGRVWWKYVEYSSDVAMILIFFHALRLGVILQLDWFRVVWYLYGLTLLGAIIYTRFIFKRQNVGND